MEVYDFEFEFRRDKATDAVAGRSLLPRSGSPTAPAAAGAVGEHCNVDLEAGSGDPSLLPRVGYRQWRTLKDAGITNRAEVASLDYPIAVLATTVDLTRWYADAVNADPNTPIDDLRPRARTQTQVLLDAGILTAAGLLARIDYPTSELNGAGFLPEAILNARAALGPEPLYRRPDVDPPEIPRADVEIDIDIDMENVLDGVYLWGALVTDRTETGLVDTGYRAFATWDPLTTDTESENFLHFWDWLDTLITSCTRAGASMLAYCWHQAAENTQLRRIARHSPTLKSRVDSFVSSGEWVDLERVFKAGWITGGSTGLKAIAPLAGFSWDIDNPGGAIAMVRYTEAAAGSTDAQAWLTNYNRGDVEATLVIGCSAASGRADQAGSPVGHFGLGPSQSGVGPTTAGRFFAHSISHGRGVPLPAHETRLLVCGSMTAETGSPSGQRSAGWRRPIRWPTSWVTR